MNIIDIGTINGGLNVPLLLFYCSKVHVLKPVEGTGELAQRLGVLTVFSEDPGLVSSTYMTAHNHL